MPRGAHPVRDGPQRGTLTISEVSQMLDVPVTTIRSWETRYGFIRPDRSTGGHRRYTFGDVLTVRRMRDSITSGRSAREAARQAASSRAQDGPAADLVEDLLRASNDLDVARIGDALDRSAEMLGPEQATVSVAIGALREIGDRWKAGVCGVENEHFLTHEVRRWLFRLTSEAPDPREGAPDVILACAPGETHTAGLDAFGAILALRGLPCINLGARTPRDAVIEAAGHRAAGAVVITCQRSVNRPQAIETLMALDAAAATIFYAGAAFAGSTARKRAPGRYLGEDMIAAAGIVERELAG